MFFRTVNNLLYRMNWKSKLNISINILMLIFFLVSLISGIIIWKVLPLGENIVWRDFLGLNRLEWREVHTYSSIIFSMLIFGHLILHYNWFKGLKNKISEKNPNSGKNRER